MDHSPKKISFGSVVTCIFVCLCITIVSCIVIRSFSARDIPLAEKFIYNQNTVDAYEGIAHPTAREYAIMDFWRSIDRNYLLYIDHLYYAPDAKQLQVSVKYRANYAPAPDGQIIPFRFSLKDELGVTNDNYFYETGSNGKYGFIRVCFEDVEMRDNTHADGAKIYRLYIQQQQPDGSYAPLENFELYNGSELYEEFPINFEHE